MWKRLKIRIEMYCKLIEGLPKNNIIIYVMIMSIIINHKF